MKWIFNKIYLENKEILFCSVIIIFILIILFAIIMAFKEVKNANK